MPTSRIVAFSALVVVVAACHPDQKPQPHLQDALPILPLPPEPQFVSRSGSEDALQVVLTTPQSVDSTIAMYQAILGRAPWSLKGDQPAADGGRTMYATREGKPPLWVMISPNPAGPGTRVSLNGAVVQAPNTPAGRMPQQPADTGKSAAATPKPGN